MKTYFWFRHLIVIFFLGTILAFITVEMGVGHEVSSLPDRKELQKLWESGKYDEYSREHARMMQKIQSHAQQQQKTLSAMVPMVEALTSFLMEDVWDLPLDYGEPLYLRPVSINLSYEKFRELPTNLQLQDAIAFKEETLYFNDRNLARGDLQLLEKLSRRRLATLENELGPKHYRLTPVMADLAGDLSAKGDSPGAEHFYQKALTNVELTQGLEHPNTAIAVNNLAEFYRTQSNYARALPLYERALKIREQALGQQHQDYAAALNNVGVIHHLTGKFTKAVSLYKTAQKITEKTLSEIKNSVNFGMERNLAIMLSNHGVACRDQGEIGKAVELFTRAHTFRENGNWVVFDQLPEDQQLKTMELFASETDALVSLHYVLAQKDPQARRLALTVLLQRKGRVLEVLAATNAAIHRAQSQGEVATPGIPGVSVEELRRIRTEISNLTIKGPGDSDPEEHEKRIQLLQKKERSIARKLVGIQQTREMQEAWDRLEQQQVSSWETRTQVGLTHLRNTNPNILEDVQGLIPEDAALVEFVEYRPFFPGADNTSDKWGARRYAAYVLRFNKELQSVDLGDAARIDRAIYEFRRILRDPRNTNVPHIARKLDELLMRPVRKLLGATNFVLLAPDGLLNIVPFGALMNEDNRYLIEQYSFTYLTSGRDLLNMGRSGKSRQRSIIIGNPDFDTDGRTRQLTHADEVLLNSRSSDFSHNRFTPLPGTAREAKAISEILPEMEIWAGQDATESALKQVHGPRIVHIATHAFYLSDINQLSMQPTNSARGNTRPDSKRGVAITEIYENPLLRSGLVLAGVNQLCSGGTDDGVLTALEATTLDLWGTKLVVLSACETGLGEMQTGEGVYGLRRAFMIAGAESQLTSLWKVDDAATSDLMVAYYNRLLSGEGRSEALRQTQLAMLASKRQNHPYYWACFIPVGEWRSLDMN